MIDPSSSDPAMSVPGADDGQPPHAEGRTEDLEDRILLASIVSSSSDAIVSKDLNGIVKSWNEAAERIFGYTSAEMVGQPITRIIPHDKLDEERSIIERIRKGERVDHFETTRVRKSGEPISISLTVSPIKSRDGQIIGASKIARDITEQKKSEAELAATRDDLSFQVAALTRLHELGMQLTVSLDLPEALNAVLTTLVEVSRANSGILAWFSRPAGSVESVISVGLDSATASRMAHFLTQETGERLTHQRVHVIVENIESDGLVEEILPDLREAAIKSLHLIPVPARSGIVMGFLVLCFDALHRPPPRETQLGDLCARNAADILEMADNESARLESENQLNQLISLMPAGVYACDAEGRITFYNRRAAELWGREPLVNDAQERFCGCYQVFLPDGTFVPPEATPMALSLSEGKASRDIEARVVRPDGTSFQASVNIDVIRDEDGEICGAVNVFQDISERKLAEDELREAGRRKDEFLATLAHELRNPLAPLRNGLELIRLVKGDPKVVEETRLIMERQLAHMVRLIDDLLDVSRISRGKIELHKATTDISKILDDAIETSLPLIEAAGHNLIVERLPAPACVQVDPVRMAQVFANILNNASRYTERSGEIRITPRIDGDWLRVSVRDNGMGIPAEALPRIFEMFTQGSSATTRRQDGLGIGLSLAASLVEMHGGQIEAHSAGQGSGAEFVVSLPYDPVPEMVPKVDPERAGLRSTRGRILVVDDNGDAATSLATMLQMLGADVRVRYDGASAENAVRQESFDLILLDIGMPVQDGYETCRRIRSLPGGESILIVALTGWGQDDARQKSREAGFNRHLVKPVEMNDLNSVLAEISRDQG